MLTIYGTADRLTYWRDYWKQVGREVDEISSTEVYPLYPTDGYVRPGMRILEAGVGMGRVMKHYAARGLEIRGMDYEPECIARLNAEDPSLSLYVGDVNYLPEPAGSYDMIMAFGTLSNMPECKQALAEFARVLRPGGVVVASVTNDNLMRRLLTAPLRFSREEKHFSMVAYTPSEWRELLTNAGLEVIEIAPIRTRLPLFTYFPFLRRDPAKPVDLTSARDGDRGLALNPLGEFVYRNAFRFAPFMISHGVVGVARKPGQD